MIQLNHETRREVLEGTIAGLLATVLAIAGILLFLVACAALSGCGPAPSEPQFAISEVGGEGFVEGAAWGQPFVFEVRVSGIENPESGELEDCVVVLLQWLPYLDIAGVPYDASPACIEEYGALPGFFRLGSGTTGAETTAAPQP